MTRGKTRSRSKTARKQENAPPGMAHAMTNAGADAYTEAQDDEHATGREAGMREDILDLRQEVLEDAARGIRRKEGPARDPTHEIENGPQVDPADPNLSAVMAEAGAQEDQASLGMRDDDDGRMRLEDPERAS